MPNRRWIQFSVEWLEWSHQNLLAAVQATDPGNVHERLGPHAPSIAFHGWHMARWADKYQAALPVWLEGRSDVDPAAEIWLRDDVVGRWNLRDVGTGDFGGTGAGLNDEESAALRLPDAATLLDYMGASFSAFEGRIRALEDDAALDVAIVDLYGDRSDIADAIASATSHADRHLGMIEAIRGVLGDRGTVTV